MKGRSSPNVRELDAPKGPHNRHLLLQWKSRLVTLPRQPCSLCSAQPSFLSFVVAGGNNTSIRRCVGQGRICEGQLRGADRNPYEIGGAHRRGSILRKSIVACNGGRRAGYRGKRRRNGEEAILHFRWNSGEKVSDPTGYITAVRRAAKG